MNGRTNGGPGGSSSPTISATPYNASAAAWTANPTPLSQIINGGIVSPDIYGIGYTSLKTCSNNTTSASGSFAAVGAGGAIFTSDDGLSWNTCTPPLSTDLYAVTGYAAHQNNPGNPALLWVAVGAGGASVYSHDGISWAVGNPFNSGSLANPNNYALHSITHVAGTFFAVGDMGTILSSTDGITWRTHASGSTNNLQGITHGVNYVAVGEGGTILTSADGNTWTARTSGTTNNLRQVASFISSYGRIYVAVGDNGTILTSKDSGVTWITQTAPAGSPNLVGITAESQYVYVAHPVADQKLGFIANAQFVAADSNGNAYTSPNGYDWTLVPANTGATTSTGTSSLNALVGSGFGYVAAGNAGATAHVF
jgi:photosystem II stability/assembly factor-like uncharacterized protein